MYISETKNLKSRDYALPRMSRSQTISALGTRRRTRISGFIKWMAILVLAFQAAFFLPNPAAEWILLLLRAVLSLLSVICPRPFLAGVLAVFPASLYLAWQQFSSDRDTFQKFVVCPKCAVYNYCDACERIGTRTVSKRCTYTEYPNHRQARMRRPCNATLMKGVWYSSTKESKN